MSPTTQPDLIPLPNLPLARKPAGVLRVLIVDDEPIARQILRAELQLQPGVAIVGEAADGAAAIELITACRPDLVFLDLEMPVMTGFEMIRRLDPAAAPVIVIVTAYDQHAIQAFEAGALDYLLKPVSQARLLASLERARKLARQPAEAIEQFEHLQSLASPPQSAAPIESRQLKRIVARRGTEYLLLNLHEVLAIEAEGDLTWIITAKQRYLATQNLRTLETKLASTPFERIHRGALVNVNHIRKLSMLTSQRWLITLTNAQEFIVSKRQGRNIRPFLNS